MSQGEYIPAPPVPKLHSGRTETNSELLGYDKVTCESGVSWCSISAKHDSKIVIPKIDLTMDTDYSEELKSYMNNHFLFLDKFSEMGVEYFIARYKVRKYDEPDDFQDDFLESHDKDNFFGVAAWSTTPDGLLRELRHINFDNIVAKICYMDSEIPNVGVERTKIIITDILDKWYEDTYSQYRRQEMRREESILYNGIDGNQIQQSLSVSIAKRMLLEQKNAYKRYKKWEATPSESIVNEINMLSSINKVRRLVNIEFMKHITRFQKWEATFAETGGRRWWRIKDTAKRLSRTSTKNTKRKRGPPAERLEYKDDPEPQCV